MPPKEKPSGEYLSRLKQSLVDSFSLEELKGLCFRLAVSYDELAGETLGAKAQTLLEYLERRDRLPELVELLQEERPAGEWDAYLPAEPEAEPPFKGLQYFDEKDAHLFFGREALTAELVAHLSAHLSENRFLAVVGASGIGKSSLVWAGAAPAGPDNKSPRPLLAFGGTWVGRGGG